MLSTDREPTNNASVAVRTTTTLVSADWVRLDDRTTYKQKRRLLSKPLKEPATRTTPTRKTSYSCPKARAGVEKPGKRRQGHIPAVQPEVAGW